MHTIGDIEAALHSLATLKKNLDIDAKIAEIAAIEQKLEDPATWQDVAQHTKLAQTLAPLKKTVEEYHRLHDELTALYELAELCQAENDAAGLEAILADFPALAKKLAALDFELMFNNPMDSHNCYVDIQAGSGGTEAQDWAQMLYRQYARWAEAHDFTIDVLDYAEGEVAGIKSAALHIKGPYAYGWLRTESGIHRLVRKSPFDAGNRRHTSFASVFVAPEVDDDFEIDINPADLRIDVYRASGAGGQHVNRTESAVRITHLPTSTVTQCQNSRSQHANKAEAIRQLRAKLWELELQKRNAEKDRVESTKSDIGWGHQIRSYVLDAGRIKDLRTGVETGNTQAVLDGGLDIFMEASLRQGAT